MQLNELLSKRILFRQTDTRQLFDGIVQELAGAGEYVKIGDQWLEASKVSYINTLPMLPTAPAPSQPNLPPITILVNLPNATAPAGTIEVTAPAIIPLEQTTAAVESPVQADAPVQTSEPAPENAAAVPANVIPISESPASTEVSTGGGPETTSNPAPATT